tara:strand:- start:7088 stop:8134 length:1047 start_codon:yes stop_codon:yes gene_type:complete
MLQLFQRKYKCPAANSWLSKKGLRPPFFADHKKAYKKMIDLISLYHFPQGIKTPDLDQSDLFILKTCQRTLIVGLKQSLSLKKIVHFSLPEHTPLEGIKAYSFLLETICGLKSRLQGENEIASQFKHAFRNYLRSSQKNLFLVSVLEKLLKDSKDIKTDFLGEIGQQSYSSISKKILLQHSTSNDVLITGTGALCHSLIKVLKKKFNVTISGRNEGKVKEICDLYETKSIHWAEKSSIAKSYNVINTIGAEGILFDRSFFKKWHDVPSNSCPKKLFIDLGHPSVIDTELTAKSNVFRLDDIFKRGTFLNDEKTLKIERAQKEINRIVEKRFYSFSYNYPFGWEELHFA